MKAATAIVKPTYQVLEEERDNLKTVVANLHKCLSVATVALRNAGLYPYAGRLKNEEEEKMAEAEWRCWTVAKPLSSPIKLNAILQRQLNEDEEKDRTQHLPDDLSSKGWIKYQQKQLYFACLRFGGDWNKDLHKEKQK
jgi:hypothetical protein